MSPPKKEDSSNLRLLATERMSVREAIAKGERTVAVDVQNQMKEAYLDYAMSVIVGRALPDVRDGLKPVHRRILYAMHERGWRYERAYVKSAKIVGEVIGNYHPHGDTAIYDTLVRMAQDFAMNVPLIDGQGNFGSVDGDRPAAYRYTEARLSRISHEMLQDIDRGTVDFVPNFDTTCMEPKVIPSGFPNLLVNGSSGIAVGMATNIPPHNLGEVIQASIALIEDPTLSIDQLTKLIPAPDFPTGGIIIGQEGLKKAYSTGRGTFRIRSKAEVETNSRGREQIIIREIPYQVNKRYLLEKIGDLVQNKLLIGISNIRDLSDRHGIRVEIDLKKDANAQIILNKLFKQTQLQISFGFNFLALVKGQPRLLNLKEILTEYIQHRREIIVRRAKYDLEQAEKRVHILEGLKIALDAIDQVIRIIRSSRNVEAARKGLIEKFQLTEIQANSILEMRLQKLTSLEQKKIIDELAELKKKIRELQSILKSTEKQYSSVSHELSVLQAKYPIGRRTSIETNVSDSSFDFDEADLIADEEVLITLTEDSFIKRMGRDTFRRQRRGGRGIRGGSSKSADQIKRVLTASTHDTVLLFSNKGKIFAMKVHEIPESSREARGRSLKAIINLSSNEVISAMCATRDFDKDHSIIMITKSGIMKKTNLSAYTNTRKGGIIALVIRNGDELIDVRLVSSVQDLIICSSLGSALRIKTSKMRSQGRGASGVIGMRLSTNDFIIGADVISSNASLFVISEKGYGKRVSYSNFPAKGRGGKGMTYLKISEKNGRAMRVCTIFEEDDIVITAGSGNTIRLSAKDVPQIGRSTMGVKLVELTPEDRVKDASLVPRE